MFNEVLVGLPQAENYFPKIYRNISHLSSLIYSDTKLVNFDQATPSRIMFERSSSFEIQHAMEEMREY